VTGSVIKPTQRSVVARHLNNILDGERREDTLRRATRIRILPRTAVMERKILNAERYVNSLCISLAQVAEHRSSKTV